MNPTSALEKYPVARDACVALYRILARAMILGSGPRVLANSIPKAGTHLLTSLLWKLPGMMHSGRHHVFPEFSLPGSPEPDWNLVEDALSSVNKGQFATAHFPARPELSSVLRRLEYRTVFILRDPRDVVVSNAFYIAGSKRHYLHDRFNRELAGPGQRILACITGLPSDATGRGLDSIGDRLRRFLPWMHDATTYTCRFESLIGPSGGGTIEQQHQEVEAVARHVGRQLSPDQVDRVALSLWSPRSSTFRRGEIGDWKGHFADDHKSAFKKHAGRELISLGYEGNDDW